MVSRCIQLKELDLDFNLITNLAVLIISDYCQNLVKLKLPKKHEDEIDLYILQELDSMPNLEYLWLKTNENDETEEILLALLPHLNINAEWIRTPVKSRFQIACPRQTIFPDEGFWEVKCKRIDLFEFTTFYRDLLSTVKPFYDF